MLVQTVAQLFKYKAISSIIVLTCWPSHDKVLFLRDLFKFELTATFLCDPAALGRAKIQQLQGVLYIESPKVPLHKVKPENFGIWYKWVIVGDRVPAVFNSVRYDADILLIKQRWNYSRKTDDRTNESVPATQNEMLFVDDVFAHPRDGFSTHPWAIWTVRNGLEVSFDRNRISRRQDLKQFPLKISVPFGELAQYSPESYNGSQLEYLMDMSMTQRDSAVRCGYLTTKLIVERLNAFEVVSPTLIWAKDVDNSSMIAELRHGTSDLGGAILRMLHDRFAKLDYAMPIWPFQVGFTYLAERESSNNMFLKPFTITVWWCCMSLFIIVALAQRLTAKTRIEKEGAYIAALATYLQQDASAVPQGLSGRWSFLVLSISAMLIHAYYTSAIVSALMSTGRAGPDSLRALGDSKYAIASEDYEYIRYLMFDVQTNWDDLEYLKRKKLTAKFYQDIHTGVQMLREGQTAYHTEYNQLFPHLKTFTDDQLCKLQYVDTIPEVSSWVTTTKHGQWTPTVRIAGAWLHETGLAKRLVSLLRLKPPPCRAALLAERVNIGDIVPVLILTIIAAITSLMLLAVEVLIAKWKQRNS